MSSFSEGAAMPRDPWLCQASRHDGFNRGHFRTYRPCFAITHINKVERVLERSAYLVQMPPFSLICPFIIGEEI